MDDEAVLLYAIQQGRNFTTPIEGIATGEVGFVAIKVFIDNLIVSTVQSIMVQTSFTVLQLSW